jgi:hypothetical protein
VAGRKRADPENVVIIINGLAGRLFGSLEQRADINIETQIREGRGDDLLAAVVAVLTELGDQDTGRRPSRAKNSSTLCRTFANVPVRLPNLRAYTPVTA